MPEPAAERFFYATLSRPRTSVVLACLAIAGLAALIPSLKKDAREEAFMPPDDPAVVLRDRTQSIFGPSDAVAIAIIDDGPNGVFNPATLNLVAWFSRELRGVTGVDPSRITSLATEKRIAGTEDGMVVERFFEEPPTSQDEADRIRRQALDMPLYRGRLVSEDGHATLISADLLDVAQGGDAYLETLKLVDRAPIGDEVVHVAGDGAAAGYNLTYIDEDASRLNPAVFAVVLVVLFLSYRTLSGVLLPLFVALGTMAGTLGAMAAAGIPFYVITSALSVLLVAISVADAIHILGEYYERLSSEPDVPRRRLVSRTLGELWRPVTITSVTSIVGFLSLSLSSFMPPLRAFGLFASLGVVIAWLLTLLVVPALLVLIPTRPSRAFAESARSGSSRVDVFGRAAASVALFSLRRPRSVIAVFVVLLLAGAVGTNRVRVEDNRIDTFQSDEPIYLADQAINENLDGTNFVDVVVDTDGSEELFRPDYLHRIHDLESFVAGLPHVTDSISIADYVEQMNRAMNENRPEAAGIPDDPALIAQYFLLYAVSSDPTDFENLVDSSYQTAKIRISMDRGRMSDFTTVVRATERYIAERFDAPGIHARVTGPGAIERDRAVELRRSQPIGLALAFLGVWATAALSFRSASAGLFAVVPVASAILFTYALMGFGDIWLGVGTSVTATIAIGLSIDFAVHTVDRLIQTVREQGRELESAVAALFSTTGRALLFNFSAIFFGIGVLTTSKVPGLQEFGMLVCVCVAASFFATLTLLPALIAWSRPGFLRQKPAANQPWRPARAAVLLVALLAPGALRADPAAGPPPTDAQPHHAEASPAAAPGERVAGDDAPPEEGLPEGIEIARRVNARDEGRTQSQTLVMELEDRRGVVRVRETRTFEKYFGDDKRTLIFFEGPTNVRGTGFLTYDYAQPGREDDQWLYLPALRKVRRVSSSDRGDSFLGTDFTYEDIKLGTKLGIRDYRWRTLDYDQADGHRCIRVEAVPVDEDTAVELGYGRVVSWIDPEVWMVRRSRFWDVAGNPLKVVHVEEIRRVEGIWTPHRFEVENLKTGHRTVFRVKDVEYRSKIDDDLFTKRSLRRGP